MNLALALVHGVYALPVTPVACLWVSIVHVFAITDIVLEFGTTTKEINLTFAAACAVRVYVGSTEDQR